MQPFPSFSPLQARKVPPASEKLVPAPLPDPQVKETDQLPEEITVRAFKPAAPNKPEVPALKLPAEDPDTTTDRPSSVGPRLGFEPLSAPSDADLALVVKAPKQAALGGNATFEVVVRNGGSEPLEAVVVTVDFDDDLIFSGRVEKRVTKAIGKLAPGQSSEMRLTLASHRLGKHACRFEVTAEGTSPITREVTVEFRQPKLDVKLIGPARRTVGSRAEFIIKVANVWTEPINDLTVTLSHDATLSPHEVTGGFKQDANHLSWTLGRLAPGDGVQVQAEFDCRHLSEQACLAVEARGNDDAFETIESCLTVTSVPGQIDLRVSDRSEPAKVGGEVTFEIVLQNLGLQPLTTSRLDLQGSEHLRFKDHSARLNDQAITLTKSEQDGRWTLIVNQPLPPDATLKLTVQAIALKPGDAELLVTATGDDDSPVETSEFTSINE